MPIILFLIAHHYLSLFSQTFFQHRYAAHGAFKMSKGWEKVFFIIAYITQGSSFLSPKTYAIMHRMHHAYTDTELDPHSPSYSKNIFDMMWRTRKIYLDIFRGRVQVEERFTKNLPDWPALDNLGNNIWSRLAWIGVYVAIYVVYAPSAWYFLLLPFHIASGAVHGAIINWFAHKYGYINYKMKNTSQNLFSVDILMLGESYHNNHHKFPSAINFGRRFHELDPIYPIIRFLGWLKVIQIKKAVPAMAHSHAHEPALVESEW